MRGTLSAFQMHRFLGLLICLIGVASVIVCYFELPLYAQPEGGYPVTGWEWASGLATSMRILGVTPTSIFGICWALTPLVAAMLIGILGIARVVFALRSLALLYLIICLLGSIVLGFTLLLVIWGLRLGALGEAIGYALCFWGDYLLRGERPAHVTI